MQQSLTLLLYSKYGNYSTQFLDVIRQKPIPFLKLLCNDNDQVRQRIRGCKTVQVRTVPCILTCHPNGLVEQYDGENAFEWLDKNIESLYPPAPPPSLVTPPQQMPPPPKVQEQPTPQEEQYAHTREQRRIYEERLRKQEEEQRRREQQESVEEEPRPPVHIPPSEKPERTQDFEIDDEIFEKPTVSPPGTFREEGGTDASKPVKHTMDGQPKAAETKDVLAKAAEMAKMREQTDLESSKNHPKNQIRA